MLFNSLVFFLFVTVLLVLYWSIPRKQIRIQNILLLAGSYFFYGWWDWRFLSLIIFSSGLDYLLGIQIHKTTQQKRRRLFLIISLICNVGLLFTFKYFDFFSESLAEALAALNIEADPFMLDWVLPLGISFYTFQTLSYTIDIYRKQIEPTRNVVAFFAFVSFFPQLLAGPIERARNLLPQFKRERKINGQQISSGLSLFLLGLFKKVVVADNLSRYVDAVYGNIDGNYNISVALMAILFSFQIYCDFSGYSNMARGIARLFGFRLTVNFREPFLAPSLQALWQRWHISLTSWFRDYVYIPLGGNRTAPWRRTLNVMIVFALVGLWHDAKWTYVIWGLLNGFLIAVEGQVRKIYPARQRWRRFVGNLFANLVFAITVLFIGAEDVSQVMDLLGNLFKTDVITVSVINHFHTALCILLSLFVLVADIYLVRPRRFSPWWRKRRFRWVVQYGLILLIILFGEVGSEEFFYFMF